MPICMYMYIISLLCSHSHIWNPLILFAIFHVSAQTKAISELWKWQKVNN